MLSEKAQSPGPSGAPSTAALSAAVALAHSTTSAGDAPTWRAASRTASAYAGSSSRSRPRSGCASQRARHAWARSNDGRTAAPNAPDKK